MKTTSKHLARSLFCVCLLFAAPRAWALTSGDYSYTVASGAVTLTGYTGAGGALTLPSTIDGNPVTSIGTNAFRSCNGLTSVTIPSSVTSIGANAFQYCNGLTSVTIPSSVTSIGTQAFYGCTGLTSVAIPSSVTSIGDNAFNNCNSLTSVTIPSSVTSIGNYAFQYCSSLTSVTIPSSVTSLGNYMFSYCTALSSVSVDGANANYSSVSGVLFNKAQTVLLQYPSGKIETSYEIPSGVTSIGASAFLNCSSLTSVTIPNGVTSIGDSAFNNCTGLTSATIPSGVTSIGNYAFQSCSSLTSATLPNSLTGIIGIYTFADCPLLTSVTIPSGVTSIAGSAFYNCSGLTSVTFTAPSSVTSILDSAFQNCSDLTSVTIPSSVTTLGHYVFSNCTSLTSVTIPSSVTTLQPLGFQGCTGLTSLTVDAANANYSSMDGVVFDKTQTTLVLFFPSSTAASYTIPSSVTSIGTNAFRANTSLTSMTIPSGVTSIGSNAFYGCSGLTSVAIPSSVTSIGTSAFQSCTGLTSVTFTAPSRVPSIGTNAFYGCSGLTSVTIPSSVTSIGAKAFQSCSGLTSVTVDAANANYSSIDGVVFNKNQTTLELCPPGKAAASYTIPSSVTSIGASAFYGCSGLTSVTIPSSVTSLGTSAFYGCTGLTSVTADAANAKYSSIDGVLLSKTQTTLVLYPPDKPAASYTIPNSVTSISNNTFLNCTALTSVTIPSSVTSLGDVAFSGCTGLTSVTVDAANANYCSIDGVVFNKTQTTLVLYPPGKSAASYTIPSSVTSIGQYSFKNCTGLTNVTIPSSVTSIGANAFQSCTGLTSVTFPSSVTIIGSSAFQSCSALTSVTIPSSVTSIGSSAFQSCSALTSVYCLGVAPYNQSYALDNSPASVYYLAGTAGWKPQYGGRPTVVTYLPVVTAISPEVGLLGGGTAVTLTGTGFTGATSVTLGGVAATAVTVVSDTQLTATTPARPTGAKDVVVGNTYWTGTGAGLFTYAQATPTITWATPAAITYGTALTGTQLNATASVAGTFVYNPASGGPPAAGTPTLGVTFTPTDTTNYTLATGSVSLTVNKATPTITWATPAAISYGTELSGTQLNATASAAGTFVYNPAAGSAPAAGTPTLGVTFTPTDAANYTTATGSVSLTVNKATPAISWATPAAITYGTALSGAQLNATASVAGTFVYNPASGSTPAAGTQTLNVTFTPTDATNYTLATGSVSLTVNKATPTITWSTPSAITYGTALSGTQLNATASVEGTFVYSPATGSTPAAGTQTLGVTFTPESGANYTTATDSVSLTVGKATPTVTWSTPSAIAYGTALSGTQLNATASVAGTFVYSPTTGSTPAAGTQTLGVTFTPENGASYTTATGSVSLTVGKATPTITWAAPSAITYGTALTGTQLNATANVAGTLVYNPTAGSAPAAGTPTLGVTFTPTDAANYTTATGSVSLTVNKATPAITWATPAAITYGTALSGTQLNATASVAGTFVYNPTAGTTPAAGIQTLSVTFTPTGALNYTSATGAVSLAVGELPTPPVITSVVVGYQQATVSFAAPEDDGGLAITVYTVTATPTGLTPTSGTLRALAARGKGPAAATAGTVVVTGTTSPIIVTGLIDGVIYSFAVTAANSLGASPPSAPSDPVIVTATLPTRLVNMSVRIGAGTGDNTLIVGLVVGGAGTSGANSLLIRAVGPTLASYGVGGTLPDPALELIPQGASTPLATNDNWGGDAQIDVVDNMVGAFQLSSAASKDAALYLTAAKGVYTAKVVGVGGSASGIALAEIYDASSTAYTAATPRLINVSARARVGTGDGVLIAGFVVEGTASRTVLIRAVGPTLATYGVGGVLVDPQLELTQAINGATVGVATNDNWAGDAQITSVSTTVGAFALSGAASKDAAIMVTLPPGIYSAKASGVGNTTGVALIEVYEVP